MKWDSREIFSAQRGADAAGAGVADSAGAEALVSGTTAAADGADGSPVCCTTTAG